MLTTLPLIRFATVNYLIYVSNWTRVDVMTILLKKLLCSLWILDKKLSCCSQHFHCLITIKATLMLKFKLKINNKLLAFFFVCNRHLMDPKKIKSCRQVSKQKIMNKETNSLIFFRRFISKVENFLYKLRRNLSMKFLLWIPMTELNSFFSLLNF